MDKKVEFNISNFSVDTMEWYGCSHAVKEHLYAGRSHIIKKLKKNVRIMKADNFIHACMFMDIKIMAESIKECLESNKLIIEKYIYSRNSEDLVLDYQFGHTIAYGIAMGTDWNHMYPASALHLVLQKNCYTSYRVVTAYAYPGFHDLDEWYDAIDAGL